MADISEARIQVGKDAQGVDGALRAVAYDTYHGIEAAAEVARAIVTQLGDSDSVFGQIEWVAEIRRRALLDVANKLGLKFAVELLYNEPVPPETGRELSIPTGLRQGADKEVAFQLAVISLLDGSDVNSDIYYAHNSMSAWPGQTPRQVIDTFEDA